MYIRIFKKSLNIIYSKRATNSTLLQSQAPKDLHATFPRLEDTEV